MLNHVATLNAAATLTTAADRLLDAVRSHDAEALAALMTPDVALAMVEVLNARAYLARTADPEFKPEAATDYEALRLAERLLASRRPF